MTTEIASAVDSVPVGTLRLVRWSAVIPERNSRNTVTTRLISSSAAGTSGSAKATPSSATRRLTIEISSSAVAGSGSTTVLKRRRKALDMSFTPRSRLFAVAIRLKPLIAAISLSSSGTGSTFSDRTVTSAS